MAWNRSQRRLADAKTDVYRVYNASGQLLYVGCSVNAYRRMKQNRQESSWYPKAVSMTVHRYADRSIAATVEQRAIREEGALHNEVAERVPMSSAQPIALEADVMTIDEFEEVFCGR